jgi:hypothetical protein
MHRRSLLAAGALGALSGCLAFPGGLQLEASTDSVVLPRDRIAFTLHNEGFGAVETNLADWHLAKRVGGRRFPLFPFGRTDAASRLGGGESHTWTLAIDNTDRARLDELPRWTNDRVPVAGLGAGRYRFVHRDDGGEPTERGVAFRAEGDRLRLQTDPGAAVREEDGVLVVRDGDPSSGGLAAITVERPSTDGGGAQRLIAEQLIRVRPLRNALSLLIGRDAERVRYVGSPERARRLLLLDDYLGREPGQTRRFRYRDQDYAVRLRDGLDEDGS